MAASNWHFPLNHDSLCEVLSHLEPSEVFRLRTVSKSFYAAAEDEGLWERFCRRKGYRKPDRPPGTASWKAVRAVFARIWDFVLIPPFEHMTELKATVVERINFVCFSPADPTLLVCGTEVWRVPAAGTPSPLVAAAAPAAPAVAAAAAPPPHRVGQLSGMEASQVLCRCFSPDGQRLVLGGMHTHLFVYDLTDPAAPTVVASMRGHLGLVHSLAWSGDGRTLASGSADRTIRLWDGSTFENIGVLSGPVGMINALAFHPMRMHELASASRDGVRIWDVRRHRLLHAVLETVNESLWDLTYTPDGSRLLVARDTVLLVVDPVAVQPLRTIPLHGSTIWSLAVAPDNGTVLAATDACLHAVNIRTGTVRFCRPFSGAVHVSLNAAARCLAACPRGRCVVLFWPADDAPV